jgi:hypothetical protein
MYKWGNLKEAERVSVKRKLSNYGVKLHLLRRIGNLVEIQQSMIDGSIHTSTYKHEYRISGQGKLRDIAKIDFHPSHIYHQSLVLAAEPRVETSFFRHSYASRKGYGQCKAALTTIGWIKEHRDETAWYAKGDIKKYYEHIPHSLLRDNLSRLVKDKRFISAFMEPFEAYSENGTGIPLGIRPSQLAGNLALNRFDRFVKEVLRVKYYIRYLDDFVIFGRTKGEVKLNMKRAEKYLQDIGFETHVPNVNRTENGLDFLGYIHTRRGMFWRKSNKTAFLKRLSRVTNIRRRREIMSAAWGMLKHGNKHCIRFAKMNGINFKKMNIRRSAMTDANGNKIIDATTISMRVILNQPVTIHEWVSGVKTSHGEGRMALRIVFNNNMYKLIVNAAPIKTLIAELERLGVTRFETVFIERGANKYDIDESRTNILAINGKDVEENVDGNIVFSDSKQKIEFNQ